MSIERLSPWITLVTNVGVLVGVILLLVELSQNTQALRNQTEYANTTQWLAISQDVALSDDLADLVMRGDVGLENLSEAERFRYFHYMTSYSIVSEASFNSIRNGTYLYDEASNDRFIVTLYSSPGGRAFWEAAGNNFSAEYSARVNQLLEEAGAD